MITNKEVKARTNARRSFLALTRVSSSAPELTHMFINVRRETRRSRGHRGL